MSNDIMSNENNENKVNKSIVISTVYSALKESSGIISLLSLLFGSITLWTYLNYYDLLYILTLDINLVILLGLFFAGYLLTLVTLLFSLFLIPAAIAVQNEDYYGRERLKDISSKNDEGVNAIQKLWAIAFALPNFAVYFLVLISDGFNISINNNVYLILMVIFTVLIFTVLIFTVFKIDKQYRLLFLGENSQDTASVDINAEENRDNTTNESSKFKKVYYIILTSFMVICSVISQLVLVFIVNSKIDVGNQILSQAILWLLLFVAISIYIVFISMGVMSRGSHKIPYMPIITASIVFILLAHILNFKAMIFNSAQLVGIRDAKIYQYRFDTKDFTDELAYLKCNQCNFKNTGKYTYINGYSIFRFRDVLILCTGDSKALIEGNENKYCKDLSGLKYKRFNISTKENSEIQIPEQIS